VKGSAKVIKILFLYLTLNRGRLAVWLKQPKYFTTDWLYTYFHTVVKPLITVKKGRQLTLPEIPSENSENTETRRANSESAQSSVIKRRRVLPANAQFDHAVYAVTGIQQNPKIL
jgi:hypothetical protein